jgi:hypothetical protein
MISKKMMEIIINIHFTRLPKRWMINSVIFGEGEVIEN